MNEQTKPVPDYTEEAEQIIEYLMKLDNDALIEAKHDMEQVIIGVGHGELPLWLREHRREAVIQARQKMIRTFSASPKPDFKPSDTELSN